MKVGRKRSGKFSHLPPHLFIRKGWYYYVFKGEWYPLKTQNEAEALKLWADLETRLRLKLKPTAESIIQTKNAIFVKSLAEKYLDKVTAKKATSTQRNEKRMMKILIAEWGDRFVHTITRPEVIEWHDEMAHMPFEAYQRLSLMKRLWKKATDWGYIDINILEGIENHERGKFVLKLTPEILFDKIYPVADEMLKRAIMLAFHFCQHENEVKKLKWTDFDFDHYKVQFVRQKVQRKTGGVIVIDYSMNMTLRAFMERTRASKRELSPYICCHAHNGAYWKPFSSFKSMWHRALEKAGFFTEDEKKKKTYWYKFKEMRHLGNTLMKDANIPADKRKAVTGHSSIQANEIYTHNTGSDTVEALASLSKYGPKAF